MDWNSSETFIVILLVMVFWQLRKISNQLEVAYRQHEANGITLASLKQSLNAVLRHHDIDIR